MGRPVEGALSSPLLKQSVQLATQCEEVSQRLARWCEMRILSVSVDFEPLTHLLCGGIHILVQKVAKFRFETGRYAALADKGLATLDDDARLLSLLADLKVHLFQVLDLQSFHQIEERRGHHGALNARFAATHILETVNTRRRGGAFRDEDRLMRIGFRLKDLLGSFGALGQPTSVAASIEIFRNFK